MATCICAWIIRKIEYDNVLLNYDTIYRTQPGENNINRIKVNLQNSIGNILKHYRVWNPIII